MQGKEKHIVTFEEQEAFNEKMGKIMAGLLVAVILIGSSMIYQWEVMGL